MESWTKSEVVKDCVNYGTILFHLLKNMEGALKKQPFF